MKRLTLVLLLLVPTLAFAQKIEIDWLEISGNRVIIHYILEDANTSHQYLVSLFASSDNYTTALTKVSGDVGTEIRPGKDLKIIWDITKELPGFKGNLTFEVRGRVFIPFVKLTDFTEGRSFKRGKNVQLNWSSGNLSGQINIELYRGQERIPIENNATNSGRYDWHIPTGTAKGIYRLRFTNSKDRNDFVESPEFTIKPKVPLLAKIAGILVVGGGIVFLTGGSEKGSSTTDLTLPPRPDLPD